MSSFRPTISASGDGDRVLIINHRLMKITLHTASLREAIYRVRLAPDGSLQSAQRAYGTAWRECQVGDGLKDPVRTIIHEFLRNRQDHRYYFLHENEITPLLNRCDNRPPVR